MDRRLARAWTAALATTLVFSACTGGDGSDEAGNGVVGTVVTTDGATTTESDRLPYDETSSSTTIDDVQTTTEPDDGAATTAADGGSTPTTQPPSTTSGPNTTASSATEPVSQAPDTALACASVEIGLLRYLTNGSGLDEMRSGAQQATDTDVADYETLGRELITWLDDDGAGPASIADAADALLARCEVDGFERLT